MQVPAGQDPFGFAQGRLYGLNGDVRGNKMQNTKAKVLFIDNFDSFTYNLVDDFCKRSCEAKVYRADTPLEELKKIADEFLPNLLVISPGPGTPAKAGVTMEAIGYFKGKLPIFGVCLGHQALVEYFGGEIGHCPEVVHGKGSRITHDGSGVFAGLENPLQVGRYHSLHAANVPDCLNVTARFEDVVMGVQHKELKIYGVQFHPESILTPTGGKIIQNLLRMVVEN
ncbi:MAG: aminodeoxychorismate/anthranilate synthase component II [Anaerohalosphaeraceae bacterium]|nr:aminodeoxychorismate/anthranilate synthase component II [Anaerohalosphaeraceae bacterium]